MCFTINLASPDSPSQASKSRRRVPVHKAASVLFTSCNTSQFNPFAKSQPQIWIHDIQPSIPSPDRRPTNPYANRDLLPYHLRHTRLNNHPCQPTRSTATIPSSAAETSAMTAIARAHPFRINRNRTRSPTPPITRPALYSPPQCETLRLHGHHMVMGGQSGIQHRGQRVVRIDVYSQSFRLSINALEAYNPSWRDSIPGSSWHLLLLYCITYFSSFSLCRSLRFYITERLRASRTLAAMPRCLRAPAWTAAGARG